MPGEGYFLGQISFHGAGIIPSLKGLNYVVASVRLWLGFVKERKPVKPVYGLAQS